MSRFLTILVLAGFLAGMLPPATCQGMASCCCAKGKAELASVASGASTAPSCHAQPVASARPASTLARRCPCTPEVRGCAADHEPGTLPAGPTTASPTPSAAPAVHSVAQLLYATPTARLPLHPAEPPPPAPLAALHGILRI